MHFELINAPETFMRLINHVLRNFIGKFILGYFNYILIYNKILDQHVEHISTVMVVLLKECLCVNMKKI